MTIINRIYEVVENKDISIYKLSKELNVSNGYFAKTKDKQGTVGGDIIAK